MDITQEKTVKPILNQAIPDPAVSSVKTSPEPPKAPAEDKVDDIEKLIPQEPYQTSPLFYEIASHFGIEEDEYDMAKNELSVIVDHAIGQMKSNKVEDILTFLNGIETKLGISSWTPKRYKHVYRYVRLTAKRSALDKAIAAYERGDVK